MTKICESRLQYGSLRSNTTKLNPAISSERADTVKNRQAVTITNGGTARSPMCPALTCFSLWTSGQPLSALHHRLFPHPLPGCGDALPHRPARNQVVPRIGVKDNRERTSLIFSFSDSSLYSAIFASSSPDAEADSAASVDILFTAVTPNTILRTARNLVSMPSTKMRRCRNSQRALPAKRFWMCGSKSLGPPVGLSGSGTKCGFSSASHRCCSISAAVGRWLGSTVRHALTKSLAVLDTFAQYSSVWHELDETHDKFI